MFRRAKVADSCLLGASRPMSRHSLIIRTGLALLSCLFSATVVRASDLAALLEERLKSVVAVEFTVQTETQRRQIQAYGTVVDAQGTVVLPAGLLQPNQPVDQLQDFKVYRAGDGSEESAHKATYLGQDSLLGLHYVRIEESGREGLKPVTDFPAAPTPALGTELWGFGLRGKEEDFKPYLLTSQVAMVVRLPNQTALMAHDLATPGFPVFDVEGRFAGLALNSFGQNYLLFSQRQSATPVMLLNVEESSVVLLAEDALPNLGRVPATPNGRPMAWFGAYGLQPLTREVAQMLNLGQRQGVVLSDILADSPAAKAGLLDRDIVLALDGKPLPRLKPDQVVLSYFDQEISRRREGEKLKLTVRRATEELEIEVTLGEEPKTAREADRRYFEKLGFTAREFLVGDAIAHRVENPGRAGVVVNFLRSDSPAAVAGLRPDDWIREVDGVTVDSYAQAVERLAEADATKTRRELVLLASRGGETQLLRLKLE